MVAEVSDGLRAFRCGVANANELPLHGLIDIQDYLFIEILLLLPRQGKLNKFLNVLIQQMLQLPPEVLNKPLHVANLLLV